MNLRNQYGPFDMASQVDGDLGFAGVDERLDPPTVQAGYVSAARNMRFRNRKAETRRGCVICPWGPTTGGGYWTEPYGAAVVKDPAGSGQWILVAADGGVWRTRPQNAARSVRLPEGVVLTAATFTRFVQCDNLILMLRGPDAAPLQCTDLTEGFKALPQVNTWAVVVDPPATTGAALTSRINLVSHHLQVGDPVQFTGAPLPTGLAALTTYWVREVPNGDQFTVAATPGGNQVTLLDVGAGVMVTVLDGAHAIPNATYGMYYLNRLLLIQGDEVAVSDFLDFTRYAPTSGVFQVNRGSGDTLVAMAAFNEDTVLLFKAGSVLKVVGASGDLGAATLARVSETYGCVAPDSVVDAGLDIYWLAAGGQVQSVQLSELNAERSTQQSLSQAVQQTFGRINPKYEHRAKFAVWDSKLFCALPLDDARWLGAELAPVGAIYHDQPLPGGGSVPDMKPIVVTVGKRYVLEMGVNESVVDGSTIYMGAQTITAANATIYVSGPNLQAVSSSVKELKAEGVLNGVAVYDFLNAAWSGVDEAEGVILVKAWLRFDYLGRVRLGFLGEDGYLRLYEEGYEDDVLVTGAARSIEVLCGMRAPFTLPQGETIQVNGGTVVTTYLAVGVNTATQWATIFPDNAFGSGLWADVNGGYGYGGTNAWTAPGCTAIQTADGVRFVAADGTLPEVKINGVPVTSSGYAGTDNWAWVDVHGGTEVQSMGIVSLVRTRGYTCQDLDGKRWVGFRPSLTAWAPTVTARTICNGVSEESVAVDRATRDRTQYLVHGQAAYDETNANDDHQTRGRQDYSLVIPDLGFVPGSGVIPDAMQKWPLRVPVNEVGDWMQVELECEGGRMELTSLVPESIEAERSVA